MRLARRVALFVGAAAFCAVITDASAHRPRARVGIGFHFGGPLYSPWWFYPPPVYHYPYPLVVERAPVYIERGDVPAQAQPATPHYWYYCSELDTYFPYVKDCPGIWKRVVPYPPQP